MAGAASEVKKWHLDEESELRFEVGEHAGGCAYFKLLSGNAEAFGVELAEGKTYTLSPNDKLAIFSWYGADLQTWGNISSSYISSETPMPLYVNLHQRLEARRDEAKTMGLNGPRVMIVGPTDSGKSTLSRILASYACRVGRCPILADLDLGQGELSIPGTIAATPLERSCLSVEEGFSNTAPLVYYFGHATPGDYAEVYKNALERLAASAGKKMAAEPAIAASGCIVNTMGWVDGAGYQFILETLQAWQIDVVVVTGDDKTFAKLTEDVKKIKFPAKPGAAAAEGGAAAGGAGGAGAADPSAPMKQVTVVKLPRSGGVVERSAIVRRAARQSRIREYFYGPDRGPSMAPVLSPEKLLVGFDDVAIVRVGGVTSDAGILPIGKSSALDPLRVTVVSPSMAMVNHILAVSFASSEKQVPHSNVAGFVHVVSVNMETRTLTLLLPCGGPLPSKYLVQGSITFVE